MNYVHIILWHNRPAWFIITYLMLPRVFPAPLFSDNLSMSRQNISSRESNSSKKCKKWKRIDFPTSPQRQGIKRNRWQKHLSWLKFTLPIMSHAYHDFLSLTFFCALLKVMNWKWVLSLSPVRYPRLFYSKLLAWKKYENSQRDFLVILNDNSVTIWPLKLTL